MRRAIASCLLIALTGCYNGPGTDAKTPTSASERATPAGFTGLPSGVIARAGEYAGIYDDAAMDEPCCWLERDAVFRTLVPKGSRRVVLTVRIPDLSVFRSRMQSAQVAVGSKEHRTFDHLSVGTHALSLAVAPARSNRVETVHMHMGFTFVPEAIHLNSDTRRLSLYLVSVRSV